MRPTAEEIDAILPQTQCGLCGYKGCMPYAEALTKNQAEINLCPPGGVEGLLKIANLCNKDAAPFVAEMEQKFKTPRVVVIREADCIGCTKCIQACPVDAILGTAKQMHTVIADECTGCELCIAPCPVDCIDILELPNKIEQANHYRARYQAREQRLEQKSDQHIPLESTKKDYIQQALLRAKARQK